MAEFEVTAKLRRGAIYWTVLAIIQAGVFGLIVAHAVSDARRQSNRMPSIFLEGGIAVGRIIPDADGATIDGQVISLRRYAQSHTLTALLFFSRSCAPSCERELESLAAACRDAGEKRLGALVIAPSESEAPTGHLPSGMLTIIDSTGRIEHAFRVAQHPHTVVINDMGIVQLVRRGLREESGESTLRKTLLSVTGPRGGKDGQAEQPAAPESDSDRHHGR